ncbi:MAG TPA: alanine--glyoxylate aminotransferase family protein [bacterium]|jgi:alanine-glyoxylate transaminase/serine-glyoxylate transaminase/serine-pyruvate transaminase
MTALGRAPERILLGPGPSMLPPSVRLSLATPLVGHMDPTLFPILEDISARLRETFQTSNELTLAVSGTGTAGMEACVGHVLTSGDRIVVAAAGYFAQRIAALARRAGADVTVIDAPWGQAVDPRDVARELDRAPARAVAAVHVETSTGVVQPLADVARIAHDHDAVMLVDAVASLGGVDLPVDRWGIDVCYAGTQKCLSAPPGMAPVTIGRSARGRSREGGSFYLDLELLWRYWASPHTYHHTIPVPLVYALHEALRLVGEEGLSVRFERHRRNAEALWAGLEAMGLVLLVSSDLRAPSVTTVTVPDGIDEAKIRGRLLAEHDIEIAGGLGPLKGHIWRIGLMGYSSQPRYVRLLLAALEAILSDEGFRSPRGAAVDAAEPLLAGPTTEARDPMRP